MTNATPSPSPSSPASPPARRPRRWASRREPFAVCNSGRSPRFGRSSGSRSAGVLILAILAGTALGARPGGPLYAARIWTEMSNLPANVVDRAQAEVSRLEQRLHEAQQASSDGDVPATEAALAAYSTIVVEAALGSRGNATATTAI